MPRLRWLSCLTYGLDQLARRIDPHPVAAAEHFARMRRPAGGDRDAGEHRALHHHRIGHTEYERFGSNFLPLDVVKGPAGGDAAFRGREKADLVDDAHALKPVAGPGDDSRPAVEVIARREAFLGDERLALHYCAISLLNPDNAHLNSPLQAISTQSAVRRRIALKRCAPMMFTIFAEFDTMLVQRFARRRDDRFCRI